MNTQPLVLIQRELDILKKYLQESILTEFNKKTLATEIASARVVEEHELPDDVVSVNTVVHVQELQSKKSFIFQIVHPSAADVKKNKVSVFAPIAIALLGYSKGATTWWEMPGGIQQFEIVKVVHVNQEHAV
jgi:regulator of nucleoside diphosphate kinase